MGHLKSLKQRNDGSGRREKERSNDCRRLVGYILLCGARGGRQVITISVPTITSSFSSSLPFLPFFSDMIPSALGGLAVNTHWKK
jgi:hypothetical protein